MDALDRLGLAENTIVCFTSDNGGVSSGDAYSTSNLPLRGGKGRQWEGGIREPFHMKVPGVTQAGSTCDVPVIGSDFYPTFLDLLDLSIPEDQMVDGHSVAPLLHGRESRELRERDLFWHYPHYGNQGGEPSSIIRRGNWKLIHYYEDGRDELYNLQEDPGEQNDVSGCEEARAKELRTRLDRWLEELNANQPEPDPEYDAEKEEERLDQLKKEVMPELEKQHAQYLDPNWEPDEDWWGSQVVRD